MDTVSVRDLSVRAVIGVHEWERAIEQTLVFNVDMAADVRTPAASDDLADALDYSAVATTIAAVVRERQVPADRNRRGASRRASPDAPTA